MSSNRIGGGAGVGPSEHRAREQEHDEQAKFKTLNARPVVPKESFISSVVASRQPPRLPLDDVIPKTPLAATVLFSAEVENLAKRSDSEIAGDIAELYLTYANDAKASGDPEITEAFDYLGEMMMNYEHLRLLRTGQLG